MTQDDKIAVLEAEIATLKFAVIALDFRIEASVIGAFDQSEQQNIEVLH